MVRDPRFPRWRDAQSLVNPGEIVIHEVERKRVFVVFALLAEGVRQACESAHAHSHAQVLAFCGLY